MHFYWWDSSAKITIVAITWLEQQSPLDIALSPVQIGLKPKWLSLDECSPCLQSSTVSTTLSRYFCIPPQKCHTWLDHHAYGDVNHRYLDVVNPWSALSSIVACSWLSLLHITCTKCKNCQQQSSSQSRGLSGSQSRENKDSFCSLGPRCAQRDARHVQSTQLALGN